MWACRATFVGKVQREEENVHNVDVCLGRKLFQMEGLSGRKGSEGSKFSIIQYFSLYFEF